MPHRQCAPAAVEAALHFADEESRAEFLREYLAAVTPLFEKHGAPEGAPNRVALAAYPDPEGESDA